MIAQIQSENTRLNNHVQKLTEEKRVAEDMVSKLKFEANNQIEELQNEFKKVLSRVQEGKVRVTFGIPLSVWEISIGNLYFGK